MAPKSADKKPAAAKAVAPKGKGSKKGKKKSVESWKIYIYKVGLLLSCTGPRAAWSAPHVGGALP